MDSAATVAAARLLGPPVIRAARPPHDAADAASHPFLQLLDANFNPPPPGPPAAFGSKTKATPRKARTENDSATYANSGNPCLDLFFQVVPDTPADRVRGLVAAAWAHDPLTALKLVCNLRGVRGTGKSDKEGFYAAALWMHEHHPRTLACNVAALAEFGYLKDFPELLFRLIHGNDVRKLGKAKAAAHNMRKAREKKAATLAGRKRSRGYGGGSILDAMTPSKPLLSDFVSAELSKSKTKSKSKVKPETSSSNPGAAMEIEKPQEAAQPVAMEVDGKPEKEKGVGGKPEKKEVSKKARKAGKFAVQSLERYYGDRAYRFLFDCVAEFFAELLASDLEQLAPGGKRRKIGLAAKWCPTPGSSFDRTTLLCEAIARRLFPRDSSPDYAQLSDEHYAYSVLRRLRREALVPLRDVLQLPEVYMSARRWSELPYTRVASVAMRRYKALFKKHDEDRFAQYLAAVEEGKAKIAAGALLPHEIASAAMRGEEDDVSELQWRRMVDDLRAKGSLRNCISVCDVSGSMSGTPMDVCVALGVLTSELSEEPWAGRVITFSARPQLHMIKGKTLAEKLRFVQRMDWCMNTNFQAVFDQILRTAVDGRLPPEKMIRTVFVFSDMEFDEASTNHWETDYEAICRKFGSAGYGDAVPQIVFWNLRDSTSTPVTSTQPGVAMVSGFSKNLLKIFLQNDGVVNPEAVMAAAIAGEEYQKLVVFD
uniref:TROVE domain-containing protein n=1 Tax=Oryza rufipogon TaxID=4529 RepID=A0A0E0QTB1_ORYRU